MNPESSPPPPAFRPPSRRPEDPTPSWPGSPRPRPFPPRDTFAPRAKAPPPRPFRPPRRPYPPPPQPVPAPAATGPDPQLLERLRRVKLFLCDVDGILTDAGVYMGGGEEYKRFNLRDGFGLRLLQQQGVKVGWISHRPSPATAQRAADLQIDFLHQAPGSKVAAIEAILAQTQWTWAEVCFMGDDLVDLGALKRAGLAVTVKHALPEARALAHYITHAAAGYGAVREVAELILKAQDKWAALVASYTE